jgi:mitogen-activated protein kinase 1/3
MKRELTGHVVTRWYRAPEIILLEKDYGPAIRDDERERTYIFG